MEGILKNDQSLKVDDYLFEIFKQIELKAS